MKLDQESYKEHFRGYVITDCVVRARDIYYFILEPVKDDYDTQTRIVVCVDRPDIDPWDHVGITNMHRMSAGVSHLPKEQFVGVTMNDHVYVMGSGDNDLEDDLKGSESSQLRLAGATADQFLLRGGISRLRTIDGRVFGCGGDRTVICRLEKNSWHYYTEIPGSDNFLAPIGFKDIDGFSANDIYAVGGKGDVWQFNGNRWKRVSFPSDIDLHSLCCARDGSVYIGAESGNVFKGRDENWSMIAEGNLALPFQDMVWHNDMVWCTSDYGLWNIQNDRIISAHVPAGIKVCAGHVSVGDGVMLLAGTSGAALHDGKIWHRIVNYDEF